MARQCPWVCHSVGYYVLFFVIVVGTWVLTTPFTPCNTKHQTTLVVACAIIVASGASKCFIKLRISISRKQEFSLCSIWWMPLNAWRRKYVSATFVKCLREYYIIQNYMGNFCKLLIMVPTIGRLAEMSSCKTCVNMNWIYQRCIFLWISKIVRIKRGLSNTYLITETFSWPRFATIETICHRFIVNILRI